MCSPFPFCFRSNGFAVSELEFTLRATEPKVQKIEVQVTMDDIQADLRVLHRLTCLFARRAGITQADIDKAAESDSD